MSTPRFPAHSKPGETVPEKSPKASLGLFLKGLCMGASDVVPGVSGGTMALILGIYEELIQSIKAFDASFVHLVLRGRFKRALQTIPLGFLLPLGLGILTAIFTMARGISWLLNHHPIFIWSFFFGLILASAIFVARRIDKWTPPTVLTLIGTAMAAYFLVGLVPVKTPETLPFIFLCGAIAICAMILPGISGSFILVLLGKYQFVLEAVSRFDFGILVVFTAGTATGIGLFVRLLSWLLARFYRLTMAALTGLMMGSLRKIWPWKALDQSIAGSSPDSTAFVNILPHEFSGELLAAIGLALLGGVVVCVLQRIAKI